MQCKYHRKPDGTSSHRNMKKGLGNKMASNSIARELLKSFSDSNYQEYTQALSNHDGVDIGEFPRMPLGQKYWIDVCNCLSNGVVNLNHLLELFSVYNNHDSNVLRNLVLKAMKENSKYWNHVGTVILHLQSRTLAEWSEHMCELSTPCDELMLFTLSCVHNQYAIVYAKYRAWCTLNNTCQLPVEQIHDLCDMHLVYLGHNTYGKLRQKIHYHSAHRGYSGHGQRMTDLYEFTTLDSGQSHNCSKFQTTTSATIG